MVLHKRLDQTDEGQQLDQIRRYLQEIARAEITHHRRRLGPLTPEQESAVEALLISTADQISRQVIDGVQSYPEDVRVKYVNVWETHCLLPERQRRRQAHLPDPRDAQT